jgi:hypothetical protein
MPPDGASECTEDRSSVSGSQLVLFQFKRQMCRELVVKDHTLEVNCELATHSRCHGLLDELTACLRDQRQAGKVDHGLRELLAQRVFSIACGYPASTTPPDWSSIPFTSCYWIGIRSKVATWPPNRRCRVSKMG